MVKIKERKSESWKPGLLHDDNFISKNKKRKDKRMSLNLSAKKIDTDEFIPIKKSALALKKTKDSLNSTPNKFLSPALDKKHTPKKKDTPMPQFEKKQSRASMSTPNPRKFSLADTPTSLSRKLNGTPKLKNDVGSPKKDKKAAGTPKVKSESAATPQVNLQPIIKSSLKKKAQKFIDHEAEEGEEPVTDKEVKPYVKGQKRKSISFKFDDKEIDSDSDDDDSEEDVGPRGFLDDEASEGEETDDSDDDDADEDDDGEDSDTFASFMAGDSDDDDEEECSDVSDEEEDDDDSDVSDEEDDDDSDEETLPSKIQPKKLAPLSQKKKITAESDSDDDEDDDDEEQKPNLSKIHSMKVAKPYTPAPNQNRTEKTIEPVVKKEKTNEPVAKKEKKNELMAKKEKTIESAAKKLKTEENVQTNKKEEKKPKEENAVATENIPPPSAYVGFIKYLPSKFTSEQVKKALTSVLSPENIVSVELRKNNAKSSNRCFVYVTDEDSVDKMENKTFAIDKTTFKVFKARESKKITKNKPVAFLPRVPNEIDNERLKSIIESHIEVGNIVKLKTTRENRARQTRNVIVELVDDEILKKIVFKGTYTYKGTDIVVRQAFESGFVIPVHRVVFSNVPENTNEVILKKAIQKKIGQDGVLSIKFCKRKQSFAFVTVNNEENQKKLLEPSTEISIKDTKLKILEFKPRVPSKRGPAKKKDKEAPAAKKQKIDPSSPKAESKKFKKKKPTSSATNSPAPAPQAEPNSVKKSQPSNSVAKKSKKKNKSLNQSQNSSPQKPKPQQQQNSPSPSSPSKNKKAKNQVADKKANLNSKLEAKKNKMKNKKNKNKQADSSD